jgi:peptide-methionine (S)-S-oxide reductase
MRRCASLLIAAPLVLLLGFAYVRSVAPTTPPNLPDPTVDETLGAQKGHERVVFAGGCFWGIQLVFEHVKGIKSATAGYAGGTINQPSYEQVSTGETGHAESVEIEYDPSKITLGQLLKIFFSVAHDPTELNRQGPDTGTQYRSAIFFTTPDQQRIAQAYVAQLGQAKIFPKPIVTEIVPLKAFFRAEDYHQDYAIHNPDQPYIAMCDAPKLKNFKQMFPSLYVNYP